MYFRILGLSLCVFCVVWSPRTREDKRMITCMQADVHVCIHTSMHVYTLLYYMC